MDASLYRASLFVLYQMTLLVGIVLLPVALLLRRAGLSVPLDRVIEHVRTAYARAGGS